MIFGNIPPELRQAMEQQADHASMQSQILLHERLQFFESLNEEQMIELREIVRICAETEGGAGRFFQGICSTYLQLKFGLCHCGQKHDKEMKELLSEQRAADDQNNTEEEVKEEKSTPEEDSAEWFEKLVKYNLKVDEDEGLVCNGCGQKYVSLEDRMLREPGVKGCQGCQHKQKWG